MSTTTEALKPCAHCDKPGRHLERNPGFYDERAICDHCKYSLPPEIWNRRAAEAPAPAADFVDSLENAIGGYSGGPFDAIEALIQKQRGNPNCGACPGDGTVCAGSCRLDDESPVPAPAAEAVAWAVVSKKGGIHKLSITRDSADRKAATWQEEWPNNGCTVRPLIYGGALPQAAAEAASIAPMAPHGTLLPEGDEFVRLMSAWRMSDVGEDARTAFDAVVAYINAWGARCAASAAPGDASKLQIFGMAKLYPGHETHYVGEFVRLSDFRAAIAATKQAQGAVE